MNANDLPHSLQSVFESQRAAFAAAPYSPWDARAHRLRRLLDLVRDNEAAIKEAIDRDFGGRPAIETELAEIWPSLEEIRGALRHGKGWMKPRRAGVGRWFLPASGQVMPQPLGVVGIIVPWNYPLYLAIGPMAAALAAGNRVMVKVSEASPAFGDLFQALCARAFAPEEITVITGGPDVAAQFSALPFDHLLFTGSTSIGRLVMGAAARNLTPVTLELGGKSPTVIAPDYPMEHAVQRILAGKLMNAGQTCIAPDYLLLPRGREAAFADAYQKAVTRLYPRVVGNPDYAAIVNARQHARLQGLLDEARALGARVDDVGPPAMDTPGSEAEARQMRPLLVFDLPAQARLLQDEIFGPILPVLPYDRLDTVIAHINARPRPLALYWFGEDEAARDRVLAGTVSGGVTVNDTLMHIAHDGLPFGGVGESGLGAYHGETGFLRFTHEKAVFVQSRFGRGDLLYPPFGARFDRVMGLIRRLLR